MSSQFDKEIAAQSQQFMDVLFHQAMKLYEQENYESAKEKLEDLLSLDDANPDAHSLLGAAIVRYLMVNEIPYQDSLLLAYEAREHLEEAIEQAPEIPQYHINLGVYHKLTGSELAESCFEQALSLAPNLPAALIELGTYYYNKQQYAEAYTHLQSLVDNGSADDYICECLAICAHEIGDSDKALSIFQTIQADFPYSIDGGMLYGHLLIANRNFAASYDLFRRIVFRLDNMQGIVASLIENYAANQESELCLAVLNDAFVAFQDKPDSLLALAEALLQIAQHSYAMAIYNHLIASDTLKLDAYLSIALLAKSLGDFDSYCSYMEKAINESPTNSAIHYAFAEALLVKGEYSKGWRHYLLADQYSASAVVANVPEWDGQSLAGKRILVRECANTHHNLLFACELQAMAHAATHITYLTSELYSPLYEAVLPQTISVVSSLNDDESHRFDCQLSIAAWLASQYSDANKLTASFKSCFDKNNSLYENLPAGCHVLFAMNYKAIDVAAVVQQLKAERQAIITTVESSASDHQAEFEESQLFDHRITINQWIDIIHAMDKFNWVITDNELIAQLAAGMGRKAVLVLPEATEWYWDKSSDYEWYPAVSIVIHDDNTPSATTEAIGNVIC